MNKVIRIAVATAFGVASTLPAFADFEKNGPSDQQKQGITSLQEVNPPALDSNSVVIDNRREERVIVSDANQYNSADRPVERRHFFRSERRPYVGEDGYGHQAPLNQVYGGVSEPGSFSEPGMKAGEFNWDHYTMRSDRGYNYGG